MNVVKKVQQPSLLRWLYLLFLIPPVLICILTMNSHIQSYQQVQQGIHYLMQSQLDAGSSVFGLTESRLNPAIIRLQHVGYAHLGMWLLQLCCLFIIGSKIIYVIRQHRTFRRPREIMVHVWAIAVMPAILLRLITQIVIDGSIVEWDIGFTIAIIAVCFAALLCLTRLKEQDEQDYHESTVTETDS